MKFQHGTLPHVNGVNRQEHQERLNTNMPRQAQPLKKQQSFYK
jgi:hypothetical protein